MLAQRAMTPERWKQVEQLFHDAQAMPPAERAAFVRTASSDDDIRREVESLLSEGDAESGLLGYSLTRATLGLTSVGATAGLAGKTLGSYQVQSLLGAGGMGEVYRARDAKLERDVAIKILPPAFTNDPDRLARFEREARMLAVAEPSQHLRDLRHRRRGRDAGPGPGARRRPDARRDAQFASVFG